MEPYTIVSPSSTVDGKGMESSLIAGIDNQRALNILARATKLAFVTNLEEEGYERCSLICHIHSLFNFSRDNHWALLQLFCSVAKSYIDGEVESWRKFQKMKAKDAFNGYSYLSSFLTLIILISELHLSQWILEWRRFHRQNMCLLNVQLSSLSLSLLLILFPRYSLSN